LLYRSALIMVELLQESAQFVWWLLNGAG